jgi:hypothetical protein
MGAFGALPAFMESMYNRSTHGTGLALILNIITFIMLLELHTYGEFNVAFEFEN